MSNARRGLTLVSSTSGITIGGGGPARRAVAALAAPVVRLSSGQSTVATGDRVYNDSLGYGEVVVLYPDGTARVDFERCPSLFIYCHLT